MKVFLTKEAIKQFSRFPETAQKKIRKKILLLSENPQAGYKLTGALSGNWSLKAWPYRIIYQYIKEEKEIWIITIAHRQGVYK